MTDRSASIFERDWRAAGFRTVPPCPRAAVAAAARVPGGDLVGHRQAAVARDQIGDRNRRRARAWAAAQRQSDRARGREIAQRRQMVVPTLLHRGSYDR